MSEAQCQVDRRAHARVETPNPASLVTDAGEVPCELLNLSCGGAQVAAAATLAPGSRVALALDRLGRFPGTVVWSDGGRHGIRFAEESMVLWRFLGHSWSHCESAPA